MVNRINHQIHLVVRNKAYSLEKSLLDLKKTISVTDLEEFAITIRELAFLKESIESLEEDAIKRNKN